MNFRIARDRLEKLEKNLAVANDGIVSSGLAFMATNDIQITATKYCPFACPGSFGSETTLFSNHLLSQFGLPGLAIATAVDLGIYLGFAYGSYKALDILSKPDEALAKHKTLNKIQRDLNGIPVIKRLPAYGIMLFATYMRCRGSMSWYV